MRVARVVVAAGLVASTALGTPTSAPATTYRSVTKKIARGVNFTAIRDPAGPWRIKILSINPVKATTLDLALAQDTVPGRETTSSMARRHNAVAAVNGGYFFPDGKPIFDFAMDGEMVVTDDLYGRNFALSTDEKVSYIGHPTTRVTMYEVDSGVERRIARVNDGRPAHGELAAFTERGAYGEKPPRNTCAVRLQTLEPPRRRSENPGVEALHVVEAVRCGEKRLRRNGGVVVATPQFTRKADNIAALVPGEQIVLGWSLGWYDVMDSVGGNPTLVQAGEIPPDVAAGATDAFSGRNPRTGVGTTPGPRKRILLVVVDGRQPGYSVGMTTLEFAKLFQSLGADWALNLDGGGSSTMVVKGEIVNRPSDPVERTVGSALVVLRGADPGEPAASPDPAVLVPKATESTDVLHDPASTGGLASWMRARGVPLPSVLRRAATVFDGGR